MVAVENTAGFPRSGKHGLFNSVIESALKIVILYYLQLMEVYIYLQTS